MSNKVVYTVIFGDYKLPILQHHNKNWDYVCITDSEIQSDIWKIVRVDVSGSKLGNQLLSRYYKTHPFEVIDQYDLYLYIDSKRTVKRDVDKYVANLPREKDIMLIIHEEGRNVRNEMIRVLHKNKCPLEEVFAIWKYYESVAYNIYIDGLYRGNHIVFRNTEFVRNLFDCWWEMIENYCCRDQLSLPYAISKVGDKKIEFIKDKIGNLHFMHQSKAKEQNMKFTKYRDKGAYHWKEFRRTNSFYHAHVIKVMNWIEGEKILDVGAGDGLITSKIKAIGIDDNKLAVQLARKQKVDVRVGSVYKIPFWDNSFDTVFMGDVLEHLQTPGEALNEIRRVLKAEGYLYIVTPPKRKDGMLQDPFHCKEYSPAELKQYIEQFDFELCEKIETTNKRMYAKFKIIK